MNRHTADADVDAAVGRNGFERLLSRFDAATAIHGR
jgi:hypothetical protein